MWYVSDFIGFKGGKNAFDPQSLAWLRYSIPEEFNNISRSLLEASQTPLMDCGHSEVELLTELPAAFSEASVVSAFFSFLLLVSCQRLCIPAVH